jgi:hypothetical protein
MPVVQDNFEVSCLIPTALQNIAGNIIRNAEEKRLERRFLSFIAVANRPKSRQGDNHHVIDIRRIETEVSRTQQSTHCRSVVAEQAAEPLILAVKLNACVLG